MSQKASNNVPSPYSFSNKITRFLWEFIWQLLFRPTPVYFHPWRCFILRLFGAKIGSRCVIYPNVRIWLPANLVMEDDCCLGPFVDCGNADVITLEKGSTVSQYSYLCTTSHDIDDPRMPVVTAPITIGAYAWVTARCFIGMGVKIGEGAVVGANSSVFRDIEPWSVVGGCPATFIRVRKRSDLDEGT